MINWPKAFKFRTPPFLKSKKKKHKAGISLNYGDDLFLQMYIEYSKLEPAKYAHDILCGVMEGRDTVETYKEGMEACQKMIADYPVQSK